MRHILTAAGRPLVAATLRCTILRLGYSGAPEVPFDECKLPSSRPLFTDRQGRQRIALVGSEVEKRMHLGPTHSGCSLTMRAGWVFLVSDWEHRDAWRRVRSPGSGTRLSRYLVEAAAGAVQDSRRRQPQ